MIHDILIKTSYYFRPGDGYPSLLPSPDDSVARRHNRGRDSLEDPNKVCSSHSSVLWLFVVGWSTLRLLLQSHLDDFLQN